MIKKKRVKIIIPFLLSKVTILNKFFIHSLIIFLLYTYCRVHTPKFSGKKEKKKKTLYNFIFSFPSSGKNSTIEIFNCRLWFLTHKIIFLLYKRDHSNFCSIVEKRLKWKDRYNKSTSIRRVRKWIDKLWKEFSLIVVYSRVGENTKSRIIWILC